ncbi:MAG: asparagine synthase (glutamine-hydrolyzing) [Desulfobacterales bacterium RIFOXYA12_FULL_46_15]|nr:MAG: asparagine synthase (glutamine-hydrolyzing) [Desulfobacula sp. GWF2_41_7]OGR28077.1 MAG: asparagine synthase (glutamine-hydrolyzing) [Desulfobacterales bacterium RIFOXYA12_FULL_46_15]
MCGIAGYFCKSNDKVNLDLLKQMTRTLIHRGPDEEGYFVNDNGSAGLGHRRLSIIDLATGRQPLSNEDGSIWISFNGEIYNFKDLIRDLEAKGHIFRTKSDTEAIVHAYEEWGTDAVKKLRGMFAFALWDENKHQLFLARDRVGKKPLYYLDDTRRFMFGSEIKAILQAPGVSRQIDYTSFYDYLSLLYVPAPKTIFKSIKKLPAGHWAMVTADTIKIESYWDLSFFPDNELTESRMMEDLLNILEESTRIRMVSEVPLGAFLSGGVDSSAVVALMAKASSIPVKTNSISFSLAKYNEAAFAQKVAELFNTDHHEFHVTPEAVPIVEKLAWHYDEPFADSSAVPTYYVSETARRSVTVSLSGDGGDENFAGYRRYYFDMRENAVRNLIPAVLRNPVFGTMGRLYPKADYLPRIFRGKAFISNVARDPVDAYYFSVSALYGEEKRNLVSPDILKEIGGYQTRDLFYDLYKKAPAVDHLSKIQYIDIKTYLCDDILTKVDRAGMAVSLEVRCPILDHMFMEYAAKIPSKYKLKGKDGKHIFKKALKKYLPDDILYRKKMGFGVPVEEWLRKDLRDYGQSLVLKGGASRQYLEKSMLEKFWNEHQSGLRNRSTELWIIMMLNLWHQNFAG